MKHWLGHKDGSGRTARVSCLGNPYGDLATRLSVEVDHVVGIWAQFAREAHKIGSCVGFRVGEKKKNRDWPYSFWVEQLEGWDYLFFFDMGIEEEEEVLSGRNEEFCFNHVTFHSLLEA